MSQRQERGRRTTQSVDIHHLNRYHAADRAGSLESVRWTLGYKRNERLADASVSHGVDSQARTSWYPTQPTCCKCLWLQRRGHQWPHPHTRAASHWAVSSAPSALPVVALQAPPRLGTARTATTACKRPLGASITRCAGLLTRLGAVDKSTRCSRPRQKVNITEPSHAVPHHTTTSARRSLSSRFGWI